MMMIIVIGGISSSLIHYDSWDLTEKCSNVKYCLSEDRTHICSEIVSHRRPASVLFLHFNSHHLRCVRPLAVKPARPQICWWWQQTPRKHLDHASPLAVCPEGIGLHESSNPWITQCVCGVICWRFTHAVANVRHFSGPDQIWWLYLLH